MDRTGEMGKTEPPVYLDLQEKMERTVKTEKMDKMEKTAKMGLQVLQVFAGNVFSSSDVVSVPYKTM